jgi:hypothetical protein
MLVPVHSYDSCHNPAHAFGHNIRIGSQIHESLLRFGPYSAPARLTHATVIDLSVVRSKTLYRDAKP